MNGFRQRGSILGIAGGQGTGKSTAAAHLVARHGFVEVGFADPMKRFCMEVFGWDEESMFGPSHLRNEQDPRWNGLTPRHALQTLGTEWGKAMYPTVWVKAALATATHLLRGGCTYSQSTGLQQADRAKPPDGVVISDCRFLDEVQPLQSAGGVVVRLKRAGAKPAAGIQGHRSESELLTIPEGVFDVTLDVPESKSEFYAMLDALANNLHEITARRSGRMLPDLATFVR